MSKVVEIDTLRARYTAMGCPGVAALIDYLALPEGCDTWEIGSGTLGLDAVMNDPGLSEDERLAAAWFRTRSLYIGSRDGSVTPLEWLERAAPVLEAATPAAREAFDKSCGAFAEIAQAKPVGAVEIFSGGKIYSVPAQEYRGDMTADELKPYQVERSWLDGGDPPSGGTHT